MNAWTIVIFAGIVGVFLLHQSAELLDLRRLRWPLPAHATRLYTAEVQERAAAYARLRRRFSMLNETLDFALLSVFWFAGGFGWLDGLVRSWGWGAVASGVAFVGLLALAQAVVELPLSVYSVFGIEGRFGFNRTTPKLFAADVVKGLFLMALLGGLLLAGFVALFEYGGAWAWVVGWAAIAVVLLVMQIVVPAVIMPWFNKFEPLAEGALAADIQALAARAGFPVRSVSTMDGSRRTSKANAFFVGIGRERRIALYDTLLERYSTAEILGVLAHEIGHYRLGHVRQGLAVSFVEAGTLLFLFAQVGQSARLSQAFGVAEPSVYAGLVFFALAIRPLEVALSVAGLSLSRRNERAADLFAAKMVGGVTGLAGALVRLYRESLGELAPHPLMVALSYSHPPLPERLGALVAERRTATADRLGSGPPSAE